MTREVPAMAMLKCPDCLRDVSDAALACPACGRPLAAGIVAAKMAATNPNNPNNPNVGCGASAVIVCGLVFLAWGLTQVLKSTPPEPQPVANQAPTVPTGKAAPDKAKVDQARADLAARVAAMVPRYAAMKPAERLAAVAAECSPKGACSDETLLAIERAGADDVERNKLHAAVERATDGRDARDARAERETFAAGFERELLDENKSPDSVTASGQNKTTLSIHIWLCSKQFLYDLSTDDLFMAKVKIRGFKRIECAGTSGESGGFNVPD